MSPLLSISDLDRQAVRITDQRPDQNVFELDLTLWNLLGNLCRNASQLAKTQFSLSDRAVEAIGSASEQSLSKLASGVILSFQLHTPEIDVCEFLSTEYRQTISVDFSEPKGVEFEVAYWLALRNMAQRDIRIAAAAFGVTHSLAKAISEATDNQVRQLITEVCTACSLRFAPEVVVALLHSTDRLKRRQVFFLKYQQCLTMGKGLHEYT